MLKLLDYSWFIVLHTLGIGSWTLYLTWYDIFSGFYMQVNRRRISYQIWKVHQTIDCCEVGYTYSIPHAVLHAFCHMYITQNWASTRFRLVSPTPLYYSMSGKGFYRLSGVKRVVQKPGWFSSHCCVSHPFITKLKLHTDHKTRLVHVLIFCNIFWSIICLENNISR